MAKELWCENCGCGVTELYEGEFEDQEVLCNDCVNEMFEQYVEEAPELQALSLDNQYWRDERWV
jgi:hypothetical protein